MQNLYVAILHAVLKCLFLTGTGAFSIFWQSASSTPTKSRKACARARDLFEARKFFSLKYVVYELLEFYELQKLEKKSLKLLKLKWEMVRCK